MRCGSVPLERELLWECACQVTVNSTAPIEYLNLQGLGFHLPATAALVYSDQLPQFYIKLFFLDNLPFMKPVFAQGFALVFLFGFGYFEFYHFTHGISFGWLLAI